MPIEYDVEEDKQLVLAKGSGIITAKDVIAHLDALAADNRYRAPMKKLVDYRSIDGINISQEEAEQIARKKQALSGNFLGERCAFVSPTDATYGTSRVHKALVENAAANTEVFRRIEDAHDWLDIATDINPG